LGHIDRNRTGLVVVSIFTIPRKTLLGLSHLGADEQQTSRPATEVVVR